MYFTSLRLTNFKNYASLHWQLSPRINCLTGWNGTGKTNVLDAIHYLCLCKSHTGLTDKQVVRHGEGFFRIEAILRNDDEEQRKVVVKFNGQRKIMEQDGVEFARLSDYIGLYPVVMIAPDDVDLVQEGSEERRRFLDTTLSQLSAPYLQALMTYNHLLKYRNALLRQFAEHRRFDALLLTACDRQLYEPAALLFEQRQRLSAALSPLFQEFYEEISGGREKVELFYQSDLLESPLTLLLPEMLEKDRVLQRTGAGPHRDDLKFTMDGQPLKRFASQGQMKSFLLSLRLAQYEVLRREKDTDPILLLDDIFDKLDEQRVHHLIGLLISRRFGQIFITDTQRNRMEDILQNLTDHYRIFETNA
jgi:DNA replication and repair protein RecF